MNNQPIPINEYLDRRGIRYEVKGDELITKCLFNNCDADSKDNEAHLYFSINSSQYHCKKCNATGNIFSLANHFGDDIRNLYPVKYEKKQHDISKDVDKYHKNLPENIIEYLEKRGIKRETISKYKLGYGKFYGINWITIPIKNIEGIYTYFKLRKDPFTESKHPKYMTYPKSSEAELFDYNFIDIPDPEERIVICEGEFDKLILEQKGIRSVSSTHGAGTFKKQWIEFLDFIPKIYICFDNDEAGIKGSQRILKLFDEAGHKGLNKIDLSKDVGEHGDITDYFLNAQNSSIEDFFNKSEPYPPKIDTSRFKPLTINDISNTLELTIKQDRINKSVTFLCQISAYTEESQFNISFNAPSTTGKSFIPTQVARLFPEEDVLEISYCSPTAFFHDYGEYDEERNTYTVDLSNKIIIFLDQPHMQLVERLRPLLSHDKKEFIIKITDKSQKYGTRTKNITLIGFPSVIFCTAGLKMDEQEATRFLLLSPEINQEKLYLGINETIKREADKEEYDKWLNENSERKLLKDRIKAIKHEKVKNIKFKNSQLIIDRFLNDKTLKPRHQRDVKRLISIIKSLALVNLWWRERNGDSIYASDEDIIEGLKIWEEISSSQELNIPPYVHNFYKEILIPLYKERGEPISRQEVLAKHFEVYGRLLSLDTLRLQLLPMLDTSGLIEQVPDKKDKRQVLIIPRTYDFNKNNSGKHGGVKRTVQDLSDQEIFDMFDVEGKEN